MVYWRACISFIENVFIRCPLKQALRSGSLFCGSFFASFAVVITLAVNVAGVLLVFAFLIIPAFSASLLTSTFGGRLMMGWSLAMLGSGVGLWLSYSADLPVGATMVSVLGALPIITVGLKVMRRSLA